MFDFLLFFRTRNHFGSLRMAHPFVIDVDAIKNYFSAIFFPFFKGKRLEGYSCIRRAATHHGRNSTLGCSASKRRTAFALLSYALTLTMSVIESKDEMPETAQQNFGNDTLDKANAVRKVQDLESCRAQVHSYSTQQTRLDARANKPQQAPLIFVETAFQSHVGKISEEQTHPPDNPIHTSETQRLGSSPDLHTLLSSLEKSIQTPHENGSMGESLKQGIAIIKGLVLEISNLKCKMDDLGTRNHNLENLIASELPDLLSSTQTISASD
jgi:hypothetical protein